MTTITPYHIMQKLLDRMMNRFIRNLEKWLKDITGLETEDTKLNDSYNSNFKKKTK